VRGKQKLKMLMRELDRITPACAGKTRRWECLDKSRSDHPRVCGENPQNL